MEICPKSYKLRNGNYWCFNPGKFYFNKPCNNMKNCEWLKNYNDYEKYMNK